MRLLSSGSGRYQQLIPSTEPRLLDTAKLVDEQAQVLDKLDDISTAQDLARKAPTSKAAKAAAAAAAAAERAPHPLDAKYASLGNAIRALPKDDPLALAIADAVRHTGRPGVCPGMLCGFRNGTKSSAAAALPEVRRRRIDMGRVSAALVDSTFARPLARSL